MRCAWWVTDQQSSRRATRIVSCRSENSKTMFSVWFWSSKIFVLEIIFKLILISIFPSNYIAIQMTRRTRWLLLLMLHKFCNLTKMNFDFFRSIVFIHPVSFCSNSEQILKKPWMFLLPFEFYGTLISWKKTNVIKKWKVIFYFRDFLWKLSPHTPYNFQNDR